MGIRIGHAARPCNHCPPCGDGWLCVEAAGRTRVMLADGIGHGQHAYNIVELLKRQLQWICERSSRWLSPLDCLEQLHGMLRDQGQSWQAAVAIVDVECARNQFSCVAIGNIQMHYETGLNSACLTSMHGMVGGRFPSRPQLHQWQAEAGDVLALFSDGIDGHAAREALRVLHGRSRVVGLEMKAEAERILRDCGRLTDDASCALLTLGEAR